MSQLYRRFLLALLLYRATMHFGLRGESMNANQSGVPSVIDNLLHDTTSRHQETVNGDSKRASSTKHSQRRARPLEFPRDRLAIIFQKCRQAQGLSLANLAQVSGIDVAHVWRIEQGERPNTSREVLIVLSMAMVLDITTLEQVIEIADEILDAAGLKTLRAAREPQSNSNSRRKRTSDVTK